MRHAQPHVDQNEAFVAQITGRMICGGQIVEDGMHLYMDDGRIIVIVGQFGAGIMIGTRDQIN